jgi:hypothetical protein
MKQPDIERAIVASLLSKKPVIINDSDHGVKFVFYLGVMMTIRAALHTFACKNNYYFAESVKSEILSETLHLMFCDAFGDNSETWCKTISDRGIHYYSSIISDKQISHGITDSDLQCLKIILNNIDCAKQ